MAVGAPAADLPAAASPTTLPPAHVRGARSGTPDGDLDHTLPATVLEGPALRRRHLALTDALDGRAGLRVQQLSGFGSSAVLQIRGSSAEQVQVYLDDLPLQTVDGSALDLAEVPLGQIERVEVYRGGTPAQLGGQAMGGALRIRLLDGRKRAATAQIGAGSWGARSAEAAARSPLGTNWQASGGVRWLQADGNYLYRDGNGTAFDATDDQTKRRQNNDVQRLAATLSVAHQTSNGGQLQLRWLGHGLAQGLPGMALYPTRRAALQSHRQLVLGEWQQRDALGAERLTLQWVAQWSDTTVDDQRGELGIAWHATQRVMGGALQTLWQGESVRLGPVVGSLLARMRLSAASLQTTDHLGDGAGAAPPMQRLQAGASVATPLQRKRLQLTPQLGIDVLQDQRRARDRAPFVWEEVQPDVAAPWTARLAAVVQLTDSLDVSASMTRSVRPPSLIELFGNAATVVGSARLQSERAMAADAGVVWRAVPAAGLPQRLELRGFWTAADALIALVQQSPHRAQYQNIQSARLLGAEASWTGRLPWALHTQLDATWLQALDTGSDLSRRGKQLPMRPAERLAARLERPTALGPWRLIPWLWLQWQGSYALDAANLAIVPARTLLAGGARLRVPGGFWLDARVDNLLDVVHFDLIGYPLPGRSVLFSIGWSGG